MVNMMLEQPWMQNALKALEGAVGVSISPYQAVVMIIATLLAVLWVGFVKISSKKKKGNNNASIAHIPSLIPWYPPHLLELILAVLWNRRQKSDTSGSFLRTRRRQTHGATTFRLVPLDYLKPFRDGPHLVVTDPDDITKIYNSSRKLELGVCLPETVVLIHGPGNLQELSGGKHFFHRKLFASLLTPKSLDGFLPTILTMFGHMWDQELGNNNNNNNNNNTIILRDVIRKTQFFLMAQILYGIDGTTPSSPERALAEQMQLQFELEDEALFSSKTSKAFREGLQASRKTRTVLWERFQAMLQDERHKANGTAKQQEYEESVVGNAFQAIAAALVESGKAEDPETLQEIQDNLLLLLEASHGTTMQVTTSMMYFLNHPDNLACLQKVRAEVQQLLANNNSKQPLTAHELKHHLPYCDACVSETLRMAPIIGTVALHLPEGNTVALPSSNNTTALQGPLHLMLNSSHWYLDPDVFPDPHTFCPERWIAKSAHEASTTAKKAYMPFGGGVHVCLGQSLARIVLKANLVCFARNPQRSLVYDPNMVSIQSGVFPEKSVKNGLPCRVVVGGSAM